METFQQKYAAFGGKDQIDGHKFQGAFVYCKKICEKGIFKTRAQSYCAQCERMTLTMTVISEAYGSVDSPREGCLQVFI